MTEPPSIALHSAQVYAHLDAGDLDALLACFAPDAQSVDEVSRTWVRGREALTATFAAALRSISLMSSRLEDASVRRYGDVTVETFTLRQVYVFEGVAMEVVSPTTSVWRRDEDGWRMALSHSIPLPHRETAR